METAERISHAMEIDLLTDPGWRERGLGIMEGRPFADLLAWRAENGEDTPPGGETRQQMADRIRETIHRTMESHAHRDVIAVVSHGGTIQLVLKMLIDGHLPLASGHAPVELCDVVNCSILHLAVSNDCWTVHCINDAAHLADLPARGRPNPDASTHSRSSQV
jgi:broad specificity phosphatase PhoE